MKKTYDYCLILPVILLLAGCTSMNYSSNMVGWSDNVTVTVKDFVTLGIVKVVSREVHRVGPLGFTQSIEGGKVTYADLIQEAANLQADEIINIRIDVNSNYQSTLLDWFVGWTRTYIYTATGLAIKYTDKVDTSAPDAHLATIPKRQEPLRTKEPVSHGR